MSRHYPTPIGLLPSVTTILDATSPKKDRDKLANWKEKNPLGGVEARRRGTLIHWLSEQYLTRGVLLYKGEEIDRLFMPLTAVWDKFDRENLIWCEKPVRQDTLPHCSFTDPSFVEADPELDIPPSDGLRGRIWSSLGYAGCPDQVGIVDLGPSNGGKVMTLNDLKTCKRLYYKSPPMETNVKKWYAERAKHEKGTEGYEKADQELGRHYQREYGWKSYEKLRIQLVAYKQAFQETTGVEIQRLMGTIASDARPDQPQIFVLSKEEEKKAWEQWCEKLDQYKAMRENAA